MPPGKRPAAKEKRVRAPPYDGDLRSAKAEAFRPGGRPSGGGAVPAIGPLSGGNEAIPARLRLRLHDTGRTGGLAAERPCLKARPGGGESWPPAWGGERDEHDRGPENEARDVSVGKDPPYGGTTPAPPGPSAPAPTLTGAATRSCGIHWAAAAFAFGRARRFDVVGVEPEAPAGGASEPCEFAAAFWRVSK